MIYRYIVLISFFLSGFIFSQNYPDQQYVLNIDSIFQNFETNEGVKLSDDGSCIMLEDSLTSGYVILNAQYSQEPFDVGLPSWNGTAPDDNSSFKVQMRFPYGSSWSSWVVDSDGDCSRPFRTI